MTTTDWIIDITLVLIVLRQIRETRIDLTFVAIPAVIVWFTASKYLHGFPTDGNDGWLVAAALVLGGLLGVAGGLTTRVRVDGEGRAFARAGWAAASIWIVSMSARLAFIVWATHGDGAASLAGFSLRHDITGSDAWTTALVLLALSEVVVRLGIVVARGYLQPAATADARATELSRV